MNATLLTARRAFLLAAALILCGPRPAQAKAPPLNKLHILLVVDTVSNLGPAVEQDEKTMMSLISSTIPGDRRTLHVLKGADATPEAVLAYYKGLKVGPDEGLLFYYSGHGATERQMGHVLTMGPRSNQYLFRSDLVAAMKAKNAGLAVLLTDCCSNVITLQRPKVRPIFAGGGAAEIHPNVSRLFFESRGVVDITAAELDTSAWCTSERGSFFTLALKNLLLEESSPKGGKVTLRKGGDGALTWQDFYPQFKDMTNRYFTEWREQRVAEGNDVPQKAQLPVAFDLADSAGVRGWKLGARVAGTDNGVLVQNVTPGGAAERLGLEAGDRIVAVNGQPIRSLEQYGMLLDGSGGWVKITLVDGRTRKSFNCSVRLEPIR